MPERSITYCRICHASCGLIVEIDDGKVVSARGDVQNPASQGFTCPKGRHIGAFHHHPERLLSSLKRGPDGSYEPVGSAAAIAEVAERLTTIRDASGPDSIATFWGTQANVVSLTRPVALKWWKGLGSHKTFTTGTIDQAAKPVTFGRMGQYLGGPQPFATADVSLIAGGNPAISLFALPTWGLDIPSNNPVARLREAKQRGLKLIIVDPRRTETAKHADVHLQLLPGTDAVLFAALLHVIFRDGLDDPRFWQRFSVGAERLRAAVEAVTPERAGRACGLPAASIVEAATVFGTAQRGMAGGATGTDMAPRANLTEHLIACLNVVCGRYLREGEPVHTAGVLAPSAPKRAQVRQPDRRWETGWRSRFGFGLIPSPHGGELPSTLLPDEILEPGADRVRALVVVAGNPAAAIPDQQRVVEAFRSLDLLVTIDPWLSETARLADYVIAPTMSLERPDHTGLLEGAQSVALAQYTPALLPRPGDVIDDWEFFWGLAEHMGIDITFRATPPVSTATGKPSTERLLEVLASRGRVSLDTVKQHPHGLIAEPPHDQFVLPAEPGTEHHRLELFPDDVAAEFAAMVAEDLDARLVSERPFRLVVRRAKHTYNSTGRRIDGLGGDRVNPLYVHPRDLEDLGIGAGAQVRVRSDHGEIRAAVAADATLRQGVVAMTHGWGGLPGDDHTQAGVGSNPGRLVSRYFPAETISNMPRLTAVPVDVLPAAPGA